MNHIALLDQKKFLQPVENTDVCSFLHTGLTEKKGPLGAAFLTCVALKWASVLASLESHQTTRSGAT